MSGFLWVKEYSRGKCPIPLQKSLKGHCISKRRRRGLVISVGAIYQKNLTQSITTGSQTTARNIKYVSTSVVSDIDFGRRCVDRFAFSGEHTIYIYNYTLSYRNSTSKLNSTNLNQKLTNSV